MYRRLLVLSLLVTGLLAAARTSEGAPSAEPAPTASPPVGNAVAGKETFTQHCSICHGVSAQGFIGPYIAGINWTVPGLHTIVRLGVGGYGGMPAFSADAVTEQNIADIAEFLASLPPAPAPKLATSPKGTAVAAPAGTPVFPLPVSSGALDPAHGRHVFTANCAACHGANAQGGFGPSLLGEKTRKDTAAAVGWIKNPLPPMPKLYPTPLSEKDVDDVAAYIESL